MDSKYKHIGSNFERTIEECSELIQEICKLTRFGFYNYHPEDIQKTPNYKRVLKEIEDVEKACKELKEWLITEVNKARE